MPPRAASHCHGEELARADDVEATVGAPVVDDGVGDANAEVQDLLANRIEEDRTNGASNTCCRRVRLDGPIREQDGGARRDQDVEDGAAR